MCVNFVSLVMEELITNSIKYGYGDTNEHIITIELEIANAAITIAVEDDGRPFNPLQAPQPDISSSLEDRETGGLGIHLIRELSDEIFYRRNGAVNRLTLKKQCPA